VTIVPWPVQGRRPLVPGTGNEGGTVEDIFEMEARGGLMLATNRAIGRSYVTGWYGDPALRIDSMLEFAVELHIYGRLYSPIGPKTKAVLTKSHQTLVFV